MYHAPNVGEEGMGMSVAIYLVDRNPGSEAIATLVLLPCVRLNGAFTLIRLSVFLLKYSSNLFYHT